MRPVIIDCDPGQDDAVALLLAFASPADLDVIAVTTVAGNVPLDITASNALRICELAGRDDLPVYAGCPRPLLRPLRTAEHVHGASGIDGAALSEPTMELRSRHGVDFLVECLLGSDRPLTLAALGPLTNLAVAIVMEPRIVPKIREIVLMGGALGAGNVTPVAEFNIHSDPHAASVVFAAGAPLTMIGLDVTHRAIATASRVAALRAIGRPAARAVAGMLQQHLDPNREVAEAGGAPLHDPCVIAYLLRPDLFESCAMSITIDTTDGPASGRTVAGEGAPNATVVQKIDPDGFFTLLAERLARL